jgi:hypothetical protein
MQDCFLDEPTVSLGILSEVWYSFLQTGSKELVRVKVLL